MKPPPPTVRNLNCFHPRSKTRLQLQLCGNDLQFFIAAKELNSKYIKKNGKINLPFSKKFHWAPLTINNGDSQKTVLVNIHSLSTRLGLSIQSVTRAGKEGSYGLTKLLHNHQYQIESFLKTARHPRQTGLSHEELSKISRYAHSHERSLFAPLKTKKDAYQWRREKTKLPRSLIVTAEKEVYVELKTKGNLRKISQGNFKSLKYALNLYTGEVVAQATSKLLNKVYLDNSHNEAEFLKLFNGTEGIVQTYDITYYDSKTEKDNEFIPTVSKQSIIQKCYLHDLHDEVNATIDIYGLRAKIPDAVKTNRTLKIFFDSLKGLSEIHKHKIIHCDIKPENILLEGKGEFVKAAITDFGLAFFEDDIHDLLKYQGTPDYLAPEFCKVHDELTGFIMKHQQFLDDDYVAPAHYVDDLKGRGLDLITSKIDVWSMDCVFYLLWYRKIPKWMEFTRKCHAQKDYYPIINHHMNIWFPEPTNNLSIGHLIWEMLRPHSEERISSEDAFSKMEKLWFHRDVQFPHHFSNHSKDFQVWFNSR
ncbi:MAG: serine/threonine protein kinase [Chlamydiales bacterium]|jgi:serine/threonine protein kinase